MQYVQTGLQVLPHALNAFEIALNVAGYCPKLAPYSSEIRIRFGFIQLVCSVAYATLCGLAALLAHAVGRTDLFNIQKFCDMQLYEFAHHGLANIFRGCVERDSGCLMMLYDLCFERMWYVYPISI